MDISSIRAQFPALQRTHNGSPVVHLDGPGGTQVPGSVIDASLTLFHKTFEHVGFGIGYSFFKVDVDYEDKNLDVSADYEYRGPVLLMAAYF